MSQCKTGRGEVSQARWWWEGGEGRGATQGGEQEDKDKEEEEEDGGNSAAQRRRINLFANYGVACPRCVIAPKVKLVQ